MESLLCTMWGKKCQKNILGKYIFDPFSSFVCKNSASLTRDTAAQSEKKTFLLTCVRSLILRRCCNQGARKAVTLLKGHSKPWFYGMRNGPHAHLQIFFFLLRLPLKPPRFFLSPLSFLFGGCFGKLLRQQNGQLLDFRLDCV